MHLGVDFALEDFLGALHGQLRHGVAQTFTGALGFLLRFLAGLLENAGAFGLGVLAGLLDQGSGLLLGLSQASLVLGLGSGFDLTDAGLAVTRVNGVTIEAAAPLARLDTTKRLIIIDGVANIADSTGTKGILHQSVFNWSAQTLVSDGPVDIDYADGTDLVAAGMTYDAKTMIWTFSRVTVTLPSTPGADAP